MVKRAEAKVMDVVSSIEQDHMSYTVGPENG